MSTVRSQLLTGLLTFTLRGGSRALVNMLWLPSFERAIPHDIGATPGLYTSCTAIVQTYTNVCLKKKNSCLRELDKYDGRRRMSDLRDCTPVTALTT